LKMQFYSLMTAVIVGGIFLFLLIMPTTHAPPPTTPPVFSPTEEETIKSELYRPGMTFEGPAASTVTLVEFLDYQCPACAQAYPEAAKVREAYKGRIRFGFRNFPLSGEHPNAAAAALAAVCADRQGHLFDYSDLLIANQKALQLNDLVRYAQKLNMDTMAFKACLNDDTAKQVVVQDLDDGNKLGVHYTPTFFINTTQIDGLPNAAQLGELIDQELKK
jgi:protein-disulfide isomerase